MTDYPHDFNDLLRKTMQIKLLFDQLYPMINRHLSCSDYDPSVVDSMKDVVGKVNEFVGPPLLNSPLGNQTRHMSDLASTNANVSSFGHALARVCDQASIQLGEQEPLGAEYFVL